MQHFICSSAGGTASVRLPLMLDRPQDVSLNGSDAVLSQTDGPVKRGQLRDLLVPELRITTVLLWCIWSVPVVVSFISMCLLW